MTTTSDAVDTQLDRLRTASGGFAMVALDQRESLREMFPRTEGGERVGDEVLAGFKKSAASILTPHASGVLLDQTLGVQQATRPAFVAPDCGLIVAADVLYSEPGAGVYDSSLDPAVTIDLIRSTQAAAIKYLIIWRRGDRSFAPHLERFLQLAAEAGVASFVEGIVRPPRGAEWRSASERFDAIVEAAAELSRGATVYKAEVPGYQPHDLVAVTREARRVTEVVDGPWVVLSNGVLGEDFAEAVDRSMAGGASGFLAGRAIWADTVTEYDPESALRSRSVGRLERLRTIVERVRPSAARGDD